MEKDEAKGSEANLDDICKIQGRMILDPMAELDHIYILEEDGEKVRRNNFDKSKGGKWILFFKTDYLYSMWKKSCFLYRDGKLDGIKSLKTSTAKKNPRSSTSTTGVIVLHCGPYDDEPLMLRYGMNVVEQLGYVNITGFIPYKTDEQSAIGTRATGSRVNFLYQLPVATKRSQYTNPGALTPWRGNVQESYGDKSWRWRSRDGRDELNSWRTKNNSDDPSGSMPSARVDVRWLTEPEDFMIRNKGKPDNYGWWLMFIPTEQLDETWKKARELFRNGNLPDDIQCVSASTQLLNYRSADGVLKFVVEVLEDKHRLEVVGRRIAKLMNYSYRTGKMPLRKSGETICSVEVDKLDFS